MKRLISGIPFLLVCFWVLLLCGCGGLGDNHKEKQLSSKKPSCNVASDLGFLEFIDCKGAGDEFGDLRLNGIDIDGITEKVWLDRFPKYDSIKEGYVYYGRSHVLIGKNGVVTFSIVDENLTLSPEGDLGVDGVYFAEKFPCSYKKLSMDSNGDLGDYSSDLFDKKSNRLRYYFRNNKVSSIFYVVDEWQDIE